MNNQNLNSLGKTVSKVSDDVALLERIKSNFTAGITTVVIACLFCLAIHLIAQPNRTVISTTVTTLSSRVDDKVDPKTNVSTPYTTYTLGVTYVVDNKTYNSFVTTQSPNYKIGSSIEISYEDDPADITFGGGINERTIGGIMCIFGWVMLAGVWINWYLTRKSKVYAVAEGAHDIANIFIHR